MSEVDILTRSNSPGWRNQTQLPIYSDHAMLQGEAMIHEKTGGHGEEEE